MPTHVTVYEGKVYRNPTKSQWGELSILKNDGIIV